MSEKFQSFSSNNATLEHFKMLQTLSMNYLKKQKYI